MDLKRLRYFCTILEQGSVSKAAEILCIAQPPLSKRLQELEEEVGAPLLVRTGRRLEPTEAGQFLYQRACEILRLVEETKQKAVAIANTEKRVLRVGVSYLFQRFFFPVIQELYRRNPRAEIAISISDSSHLEYLLQKGTIDIALMQRPKNPDGFELANFRPVGLRALVSTELLPTPPEHPLSTEDFGNFPLILMRRVEGVGTFEAILEYLRKSGVEPHVKMHVSDPCVAIEMLETGTVAAVFVPASEVIPSRSGRYIAVDVHPSPLVFVPAAVRLSIAPAMPEVQDIISDFI
jgi:DNA-binding transcriptional LysR family regulator